MNQGFYVELDGILEDGFTGDIVLHCDRGRVAKYELREVRRPKTEVVDLTEVRNHRKPAA